MLDNIILSPIPLSELIAQVKQAVRDEMAVGSNSSPGNTSPAKPLTQNELCEYLGITAQTVIRWKKKKKIPFIQVGSCPRFILSDVLKSLGK